MLQFEIRIQFHFHKCTKILSSQLHLIIHITRDVSISPAKFIFRTLVLEVNVALTLTRAKGILNLEQYGAYFPVNQSRLSVDHEDYDV